MQEHDPFEPPGKIVKPRARTYHRLPVVALSNGIALDENGETYRFQPAMLETMPSTLFVKIASAAWLTQLDKHYAPLRPTTWQWRVGSNHRDIIRQDGKRIATRVSTTIHYFGFKNDTGQRHAPGVFHKVIDPVVMYGHNLDKIFPGDDSRLIKLFKWGVLIRDFCDENQLEVRPTTGGIAGQFLTDRRFYPKARRKVPAAINERTRTALPGNHYTLAVEPDKHRELSAWYIDQTRAHHYHARTTELPDADSLYAYGFFAAETPTRYAFTKTIPNFYGLYLCDLQSPRWHPDRKHPHRGAHFLRGGRQYVYSNELEHLMFMGYKVKGIYAAWGSRKLDAGLGKYATWAETQLDTHNSAPWIKPLLLSAYGVLATTPRQHESIFRIAKRGETVSLLTGQDELSGTLVTGRRKLEPAIANVLHRGMIEAATRSESVWLAQDLDGQGYRVLSIYADAVIVENDGVKPEPQLVEPWRVKTELNHLQFLNRQAFVSGEMTKLPGVSQELRNYHLPKARKMR
jgi:hypothetical protein